MMSDILDPSFYTAGAPTLARQLLGKILVHDSKEGRTSGLIVETEAYLGAEDPASHAFRGRTPRNGIMFEAGGVAYVYFTYGLHYCFNVVAGEVGDAEAVLIRALEPIEGLELMQARRAINITAQLTNGPAKLTQAMGISMKHYGHSLAQPPLTIRQGSELNPQQIIACPRIGISQATDRPLRFYIRDNPFVSKR